MNQLKSLRQQRRPRLGRSTVKEILLLCRKLAKNQTANNQSNGSNINQFKVVNWISFASRRSNQQKRRKQLMPLLLQLNL